MITIHFGPGFQQQQQQPFINPDRATAWPYYLCELIKDDQCKEVYLPVWECVEGVEVSLGGLEPNLWRVAKVIHQIYREDI